MSRRKTSHITRTDLPEALPVFSCSTVLSSDDKSSEHDVDVASSNWNTEKELLRNVQAQSTDLFKQDSTSNTVPSMRRKLRVRSCQKHSKSNDECDVVIDTSESDETNDPDPAEKIVSRVGDMVLFDNNSDVAGEHVFGFRTSKKRDSMVTLAQASAQRTPKTPKTPKPSAGTNPKAAEGVRHAKLNTPKAAHGTIPNTPKSSTRTTTSMQSSDTGTKNEVVEVFDGASFLNDFSASESDYIPTDSSDEEDSTESGDDADDDTEVSSSRRPVSAHSKSLERKSGLGFSTGRANDPGLSAPTAKAGTPSTTNLVRHAVTKKPAPEYYVQSDDYFSSHTSAKVTTSDKTLDLLEIPRFEQGKISQLLAGRSQPDPHSFNIQEMLAKYEKEFLQWMIILNEGFNLMLHGVGSKRSLLDSFMIKQLVNNNVVVVNGYFPALTAKDVLDDVANGVLELKLTTTNIHEAMELVERNLRCSPDVHLFLLVHNLDGEPMRNERMQTLLCRLAIIPNVHIVASIDSILAPLMWDTAQLSSFNFSWRNVTTMLPYTSETAYENSLLVQNCGAPALSSMRSVFASLTSNARGIFMAIVRYQIANGGPGHPNYNGMPLKDLYWTCREAFLVSSDVALRTQLTEFTDHKLLRIKRTVDGGENLHIPLEYGLLQRFVSETAADK